MIKKIIKKPEICKNNLSIEFLRWNSKGMFVKRYAVNINIKQNNKYNKWYLISLILLVFIIIKVEHNIENKKIKFWKLPIMKYLIIKKILSVEI